MYCVLSCQGIPNAANPANRDFSSSSGMTILREQAASRAFVKVCLLLQETGSFVVRQLQYASQDKPNHTIAVLSLIAEVS
jgi:hypothetical protein